MYSNLIGNELRAIRSRLNISLNKAQEMTGIYAQKLSEYENSKVNIKVYTLEKILNAYGLNLYIFFKNVYEYTHEKDKANDS